MTECEHRAMLPVCGSHGEISVVLVIEAGPPDTNLIPRRPIPCPQELADLLEEAGLVPPGTRPSAPADLASFGIMVLAFPVTPASNEKDPERADGLTAAHLILGMAGWNPGCVVFLGRDRVRFPSKGRDRAWGPVEAKTAASDSRCWVLPDANDVAHRPELIAGLRRIRECYLPGPDGRRWGGRLVQSLESSASMPIDNTRRRPAPQIEELALGAIHMAAHVLTFSYYGTPVRAARLRTPADRPSGASFLHGGIDLGPMAATPPCWDLCRKKYAAQRDADLDATTEV